MPKCKCGKEMKKQNNFPIYTCAECTAVNINKFVKKTGQKGLSE